MEEEKKKLSKYHDPYVSVCRNTFFPFLSTAHVSLLADGMAGQVSPEALLSRLQTEGGKTEAESEVRTYTLGT